MIGVLRAGVDGWNGGSVDRGSLNQVVDEEEKQHYKGQGIGQCETLYKLESTSTSGADLSPSNK